MLLLNVPNPTGFEYLRTVDDVVFVTFLAAAIRLNLLFDNALIDEVLCDHFAIMLVKGIVTNIAGRNNPDTQLRLWERHRDNMYEDFRRRPNLTLPLKIDDLTLRNLERRFRRARLTCRSFRLPDPFGPLPEELRPERWPPLSPPGNQIVLNSAHQEGFDRIMTAARECKRGQRPPPHTCFFVNGPGGSGKTTLYREIIRAARCDNIIVKVFATTGIAATMMEWGVTAHSGLGLPIVLNQHARSWLENAQNHDRARELADASVILIVEITMMSKDGLQVIDRLLRILSDDCDSVLGGKVVAVGGDVSSPLWRHFRIVIVVDFSTSAPERSVPSKV